MASIGPTSIEKQPDKNAEHLHSEQWGLCTLMVHFRNIAPVSLVDMSQNFVVVFPLRYFSL